MAERSGDVLVSLNACAPAYADVPIRGGTLRLRGLTLADLSAIACTHADAFAALMAGAREGRAFGETLPRLLRVAPGVAAHAIALAADEPGATDAAARLPLPVTIRALAEIDRLTFADAEDRQAVFAQLRAMVAAMPAAARKGMH